MTARLYDLTSSWTIPNTQQEVWDVIADPDMSWPDWWRGCTVARPPVRGDGAGSSAEERLLATTSTFRFKASLGYTLTVSFHPTSVRTPHEVVFDAGGDLDGVGRVVLAPINATATKMDIEWRVRTTKRWMELLKPVAGPAFTFAHDGLMRRGEEGLTAFLRARTQR
ncbi:hypothetical protein [Arthrobacter sp. 35W]|uniref:hypothetical protein n=1 Tax=Arthrobacter sp. 35W TaxID=1132441 RepID=UPI000425911B|nr:hypothetical protein [Arthrobacter sp. 35W]